MKIRTGFVANSSSSSFVIAAKKVAFELPENLPAWVYFVADNFKQKLEREKESLCSIEAIDEYLADRICAKGNLEEFLKKDVKDYYGSTKKLRKEMHEAYEKGFEVFVVELDRDENSGLIELLSAQGKDSSEDLWVLDYND